MVWPIVASPYGKPRDQVDMPGYKGVQAAGSR